jgi:dTMP kinase
MRGAFITLEGTEGVGKSTSMAEIEQLLTAAGQRVVVTREPGGTPIGEQIRHCVLGAEPGSLSAETEALLMFAGRAQHLRDVIRPALERGDWVVCDRFSDATLAYQGAGRGADEGFLRDLMNAVHGDLTPDLTLLLDAPLTVAFARIGDRPLDHFEQESRQFFERVRQRYLDLAADEPRRVKLIDARDTVAAVRQRLRDEVAKFLASFGRAS